MSNDQSSSSRRKLKFSIEPVRVTDQDQASVKRVLGRLTGRVPFPADAEHVGESSTPSTTGITHSTGNTLPPSDTLPPGITQETGSTAPSGSTHPTGDTSQAGTTQTTGTTPRVGTTRRTGSTRRGRAAVGSDAPTAVTPVSPARDFQKVPNSVTREMAARLFRGRSRPEFPVITY